MVHSGGVPSYPVGGADLRTHKGDGRSPGIMPRLLLIKDSSLVLELENSFVRRPDFELLVAEDGARLLAKADEVGAELIIAGVSTSGIPAFELCRRLRAFPRTASTPVLLCGLPTQRDEAKAASAAGFLAVPWSRSQLLAAIRPFFPVAERRTERAEVSMKVMCDDGRDSYVAFTRDISTTGLFLKGAATVDPGAKLRLRLSLSLGGDPDPTEYEVLTEVVRRVPADGKSPQMPGIGVRFLDFPLERRLPLARFVREHVPA